MLTHGTIITFAAAIAGVVASSWQPPRAPSKLGPAAARGARGLELARLSYS